MKFDSNRLDYVVQRASHWFGLSTVIQGMPFLMSEAI